MTLLSADGKIMNGGVINFLVGDETSYPQLTRLYLEFDFRIIEVSKIDEKETLQHQFTLAYHESTDGADTAVTPSFDTLEELESYTEENVIAILQKTVFESTLATTD